MFSEFISVNGVGIKGGNLIYCSVERDAGAESCENIHNGIEVGMWNMVAINSEGGVVIEDRFTEVCLVVVSVFAMVVRFGHSSPP